MYYREVGRFETSPNWENTSKGSLLVVFLLWKPWIAWKLLMILQLSFSCRVTWTWQLYCKSLINICWKCLKCMILRETDIALKLIFLWKTSSKGYSCMKFNIISYVIWYIFRSEVYLMSCFCKMVDQQTALILISSWDNCHRFLPSQISGRSQAPLDPTLNQS